MLVYSTISLLKLDIVKLQIGEYGLRILALHVSET